MPAFRIRRPDHAKERETRHTLSPGSRQKGRQVSFPRNICIVRATKFGSDVICVHTLERTNISIFERFKTRRAVPVYRRVQRWDQYSFSVVDLACWLRCWYKWKDRLIEK